MSSNNIYTILESKSINTHYLNRYYKFILNFKDQSKIKGETEHHHILPKAKSLFPEYSSLKDHPWNGIHLTKRQHWIAHWMLSKAFGDSQTIAFYRMCKKSKDRITSKVYETMRIEVSRIISKDNIGMASYVDGDNNKIRCSTTDPRVLSGELISTTKGRNYKPRSEESRLRMSIAQKESKYNPNRTTFLYKLDVKLENILLYSSEYQHMLLDGWSIKCTPEYRTKITIESNKNRSKECRIQAAIKQQETKSSRVYEPRIVTVESRKNLRRGGTRYEWELLYYDKSINDFVLCDRLDINDNHIQVFAKNNSKLIYDINDNKRFLNLECPILPYGYFEEKPSKKLLCFNLISNKIEKIIYLNYNKNIHIILNIPNGGRLKYKLIDYGNTIYLNKEFISLYGVPDNCTKNLKS
jgi:hypothetical protein